jgi:hypothetical protein
MLYVSSETTDSSIVVGGEKQGIDLKDSVTGYC